MLLPRVQKAGQSPCAFGEFHAGFDAEGAGSGKEAEVAFGFETSGGIDAVRGLKGDDVEVSIGRNEGVGMCGIAGRTGVAPGTVVLELAIAEAGVTGVVGPEVGIGFWAQIGCGVELVAPHQAAGIYGGCELLAALTWPGFPASTATAFTVRSDAMRKGAR